MNYDPTVLAINLLSEAERQGPTILGQFLRDHRVMTELDVEAKEKAWARLVTVAAVQIGQLQFREAHSEEDGSWLADACRDALRRSGDWDLFTQIVGVSRDLVENAGVPTESLAAAAAIFWTLRRDATGDRSPLPPEYAEACGELHKAISMELYRWWVRDA